MLSLNDWTSYFFMGCIVAAGLGTLYYWENFDIYNTQEATDKQWNEPELKQGVWRLGHLPARGAKVEPRAFVVFKFKSERSRVARVVAMEGQRVAVQDEQILVDGAAWTDPLPKSKLSKFDVPEIIVPRGSVFVVCDQRAKPGSHEEDSRLLGPIPLEAVTHTFQPLGVKAGR